LEELPEIDANAYAPPALGKEDGHHGVDFSYWRYKDKIGMAGLPIYSVLPGTVAMADSNHKPYGNAVIIETPLKDIPQSWIDALNLPAAEPLWDMDTRLYCPKPTAEPTYSSERSLYLLYAHLENPPEITPGQTVAAGDTIGLVGHSGNAINDHLHLEVRVGPSDVKIPSMDHYDNGASDEVMWNYCTWRISGHFKLIDPMLLLSLKP
jgi:murein DD-endopeptidase MepM/ murein hydrolase activator NlpD